MRRPVATLICLWLCCSAAVEASANDKGQTDNIVRLGVFESKGMFEGASEGMVKSGYCFDYMMQIANYTGWKYEFCYGSFAELYEQLKNGQIDMLPYTNWNAQRAKEVLFSKEELAEEEYFLAVDRSLNLSGGLKEALDGKTISTMVNANYNGLLNSFIKSNGLDVNIDYYHYVNEIWDAMRNGTAQATIFTSISFSNDNWQCIGPFGLKPTYISVKKDRQDLVDQLDEAAEFIRKSTPGFKDALYSKYFQGNPMRKSLTQEEKDWVDAHPVLHVGGFTKDAPYIFSYDSDTHQATGLTVDVINGIIERLGLDMTAEFICYPTLQELEAAMDSGQIDVILPFYPDYHVAQQHNLLNSNVVRVSNMELVYKKGLSSYEAVIKIATPATKLGKFYVQDIFKRSEIVDATSIQDAVNRVLTGEATGAVAQNYEMHRIKEEHSELTSIVLAEGCGTCFATRPQNYPLIRLLNRGLNYYSSVEISAIATRYTLETPVTVKAFLATHKELEITLGVILILLIVIIIALVQMVKSKKRADAANRSKTTFLFNMSHDIRTPMNAILGYTDIAIRHYDEPEMAKSSMKKIKSAGEHLLNLINDILEMSRIEAGKLELVEKPYNINNLILSVGHMAQALATPKSIKFEIETGEFANAYVYADELHYNEVMVNLVSNAIKYTPEDGEVRYSVKQISDIEDGRVTYRFQVIDNGLGMSEEFQKHVFDLFARERSATVSRQEGAGLGLSIVKRIVDMAGGTIVVNSAEGKGTTVTVEIPLRVMSDQEIQEFVQSENANEEIYSDADLAGKKILLVDDNELNREIAEVILTESGLEVETATDGYESVEMIREKGAYYYDYVLMDVQMPVMDGYQATQAIRQLPEGDRIAIIALSANAFDVDIQKSLDAGMNAHVAKPIDVAQLFKTMHKLAK